MHRGERKFTREVGLVILEATAVAVVLVSLLFPLVGVFDLLLTRQQVNEISNTTVVDSQIKAFRLFSGSNSWYTRAVNAADEGALDTSKQDGRKVSKTKEYHARLTQMADTIEKQVRGILGQRCVANLGCSNLYRIELRVVMPYIVHDTGDLIRIICGPSLPSNAREGQEELRDGDQQNGCLRGRVDDWRETDNGGVSNYHRFLRVRGDLNKNNKSFGTLYISELLNNIKEKAHESLAPYTIPSGLFRVRHNQNYGSIDYQGQYGHSGTTHPDLLRHVMFLGVRVYVDLEGTPGGFILKLVRQSLRGDMKHGSMTSVLSSDVLAVPRQEF